MSLLAPPAPRVLVTDDEDNIRFLLDAALRHFGFDVVLAANGREALGAVADDRPDLIVLDVMLPDLDGFEVCRRLRADGVKVPVLFLTARDGTEEKVRGLTLGGDDYVTKPFSLEEVVARVRAILRRANGDSPTSVLRFADLEMDEDAHVVRRAGVVVDFSPTEYKLLRYLLINAGRVVTRAQILDHVWEYDFGGEATVVETYVSYLRKKLDPLGEPLIKTVRGVGYALRQD
ncbi:MAG TPA: response regulator transcription factor [Acidimicrobiales bacterium]|nr:response regulator transcription factor [Acidimicrobiales bacterium]